MSALNYLLSVIDGSRDGPTASILRLALGGLAHIYSGVLELYLLPYRLGLRRQFTLPCPVISVGNLTVGGTGKTPMTRSVTEILRSNGLKVCVLSRGYRGANEHGAAVVSTEQGVELGPADAGDEASLLAQLMPGVPVIAGKDRRRTGALAYDRFRPDVIVLDDGMQFYQLRRNLDIVLLDSRRPFDNQWTFPRGLLREPPSHLRRAGCVVITNSDKVDRRALDRLRQEVRGIAPGLPILTACLAPQALRALDQSNRLTPGWLANKKVALLSAIGNPESFAAQVADLGAAIVYRADFPDHYSVSAGELSSLIEAACSAGAEAIITTEKDAVKLPPIMRPVPFLVLEVSMAVDDPVQFERILIRAVRQ